MAATVKALLAQATELPSESRAELAELLLESLSFDFEADNRDAWITECRRRAREHAQGKAPGVSWDDVEQEMDEFLNAKNG